MQKTLIHIEKLRTYFPKQHNLFGKPRAWLKAVDDVTLDLLQGECLGLAGESGCGKSTLGRTILRTIKPYSGTILFDSIPIHHLANKALQPLRPRMQMVFQHPRASLNPKMTILKILSEAIHINPDKGDEKPLLRAAELLHMVDLCPEHLFRYPDELSGGQQQRICIARALATNPDFIVFDESTSALDVSVQAQILSLMERLRKQMNLTYLFISHDLSVLEQVCHRIAVMYAGQIVEMQEAEAIFRTPKHPYTKGLRDAVPIADPTEKQEFNSIKGEVPSLITPPDGCCFHPRCEYASEKCKIQKPKAEYLPGERNWVCCHNYKQLHFTDH